MAQIGIVHGSSAGNTAAYAEIMQQLPGKKRTDLIDIPGPRRKTWPVTPT
jgi:flavodoxin